MNIHKNVSLAPLGRDDLPPERWLFLKVCGRMLREGGDDGGGRAWRGRTWIVSAVSAARAQLKTNVKAKQRKIRPLGADNTRGQQSGGDGSQNSASRRL
jgi:hypothetical protein